MRLKLHAEAPKAFPTTTWYTGDNIEMAFGQGATVLTPIEQAVAYSTFANYNPATGSGTRYAPQVASEVVDPITGKVVKKLAPQVTGHVTISPANYAAMLAGFEGVISNRHGTAYEDFQGFPTSWNLAGKTGTASNAPGLEPNSWFVAFGPEPQSPVPGPGGHRPGRLRRRCGGTAGAQHLQLPGYTNPVSSTVTTPTPSSPPSLAAPGHQRPVRDADRDHHDGARPEGRRDHHDQHHPDAGRLSAAEVVTLAASMETIWPQLERLLPQVTKPARYIGGEQGAVYPEHGPGKVAWLLLYPDTYEIGLPNQGLQILYEILNERPDAVAERSYAPWVDLEQAMRAAGVPLFSVEQHLPAAAFDVLAFNLSAELVYTNVVNLIDLAGVPLHAAERGGGDALVLAGGHCAFNPEPLADFVDAFVLGDGEEVVGEINEVVREWLARPEGERSRDALRRGLARLEGVYVPALYEPSYADGRLTATVPVDAPCRRR